MQITHEEAHKLIQFNIDGALMTQQKRLLTSHLDGCAECQKYAQSIENVESLLRPMLHRQWDQKPLPLSIGALRLKQKSASEGLVAATRLAALAVVFLGFFYGAWNFNISARRTPTPFLPNVPVIPTPFTSTVTAGTKSSFENCAMTSYVVAKNDTLASIAYRFSVNADDIALVNAIHDGTVRTGERLSIPICNPTPTNPAAAHTTTFTPALYSPTITPDG